MKHDSFKARQDIVDDCPNFDEVSMKIHISLVDFLSKTLGKIFHLQAGTYSLNGSKWH